ncbi:MAG: hypothetical protein GY859_41010 [Desulfobacterales bacterium]|nr:hypothetical protein [Desulfobacterales bacterium]
MSVNTEGQRAGTREEKTPAGHTAAARGSRSAIGEIDKNGAGEKGKNRVQQDSGVNFRPMERSGKRVAQFDSQADNHQAGSRVDTGMQAPGEIKRETGNDSRPGATGSFNGLWPFSAPGLETPALHVKGKGDDLGHINEVRIINGQGKDYPLKDGEKVEEKISLSAELCWPSLPGEKDSQDVGGARFTATWPSLPEEQSADVKSLSNQMALHPSKAESRNIERLRRLDEEQKGTPWSGSHF